MKPFRADVMSARDDGASRPKNANQSDDPRRLFPKVKQYAIAALLFADTPDAKDTLVMATSAVS